MIYQNRKGKKNKQKTRSTSNDEDKEQWEIRSSKVKRAGGGAFAGAKKVIIKCILWRREY